MWICRSGGSHDDDNFAPIDREANPSQNVKLVVIPFLNLLGDDHGFTVQGVISQGLGHGCIGV